MSLLTEEIRDGSQLAAGRYRVRKRLGAGGMATVFLAEDERLGRPVAIKRLHTDAPGASLRRFKQEARLGAALNHPNLVAVYDTVNAEEGALIVMEYVEGRSLAEMASGRPMDPSRALPILRDVADALDHAHAEGVVHRDVKPANVLVAGDGTAKLADLGIARAIGATQITSEGSVVGTLPYMSPERLAGPGAGGPESDVFALAAVATELLSGKPPAQPASTGEAAGRPPLDLRREWPDGPAAAIAVLERALDDDPARRQPSAGRLVAELEAALKRDPLPATQPLERPSRATTATAVAGTAMSRPPSRWTRIAAVCVLALGLMAVGASAAGIIGGGDGAPDGSGGKASPAEAKEPKAKPEPKPEPAPAAAAPVSSEPSGAELNDQGFALIEQGRYEEAVPVLERAVDALRGSGDELTYAYALYNLGHALRLSGRPEEAIPVLEERLGYPDQRETVERELAAAYADAGRDAPGGREGGPPFGKAKGHDRGGGRGEDDD